MKTVLVTGGAGYIGSHIVENLNKKKFKVIIFDDLSTGYKYLLNKKNIFIKGNIKNFKLLKKTIHKEKIDSIIHLAALLNVKEAEKKNKKYYNNNIKGTLNLIKACKNSYVKRIIFSSSCSIYGNVKGPVRETKKPKPNGYYAYTKLQGEKIIKKYSKKFHYNYSILRYFNVAGASKSGKIGEINKTHGHLIKNISLASLNKKPIINIYGSDYDTKDGTCIRDYIHVSDLVGIHIKALFFLNKKKSLILNCGYGKGYSVLDIVKNFRNMINKKITIKFKTRRPGDVDNVYANTNKLYRILKWKPKYNNIKTILKSSINWEKKINRISNACFKN